MKKLLHIIASPRELESRTLQIADPFLEVFQQKNPDCVIDELHLEKEELPSLSMKRVDGKYFLMDGKDLYGELKEKWMEILSISNDSSQPIFISSAPPCGISISPIC